MDNQEAREILQLYRPGVDDATEPQVTEALRRAQQDPELGRWFQNHCNVYSAIRQKLREIPVPEDLKSEILRRENLVRRDRVIELRRAMLPFAAAAAFVVLAGVLWMTFVSSNRANFVEFRDRLVRQSQRPYGMMANTNLAEIHASLLAGNCPDYAMPKALAKLPAEGYAPLDWRGRKISMVCLKTTKNKELYLLVMDGTDMRNTPTPGQTDFLRVLHLNSASWTSGGKVYILAGPQDDSELKQYLN